jgi:mutator protein MutT
MFSDFLSKLWRRAPSTLRRLSIRLIHTRFTATAGAVVIDDNGRVLLLKHRYRTGSGWGMPGGFIERGEQPLEALRRELREEVGLEIANEKIAHARSFPTLRQIEILFLCNAAGEAQPQSAEVIKAEWFAYDNLPAGLPNDQRALLVKILEQQ